MKSFFSVEKLCYAYIKQPLCLRDVGFSAGAKDNVLILGLDEKGKSTLIKTISGFDRKFFGMVSLEGVDIKSISDKDKNFSLILNYPVLIHGTIDKNLNYLYDVLERDLPSIDEKVKLLKLFNLNFDLNTSIKSLSLCERFKLCFLRVYIKKSRILFIDDIFSNGFTDEEIEELVKLLNLISKDCLMFLCANDKAFLNQNIVFQDFSWVKVLYLNMAKVHEFQSIKAFLDNPIDLDCLAFDENYITKQCSCVCQNGEYYLSIDDLLVKIDKVMQSNFDKLKLDDMDDEDVVFAYKKGQDIDFSRNNDINKMIIQGEVLLFSKLDRSRIN